MCSHLLNAIKLVCLELFRNAEDQHTIDSIVLEMFDYYSVELCDLHDPDAREFVFGQSTFCVKDHLLADAIYLSFMLAKRGRKTPPLMLSI